MTDGTTAIQVSPVKEEDMAKVREVFQKALDAIIAATELSKTVQQMRSDVDRLRKDIEDTQARNIELDRMLADTRRQRDDAERELSDTRHKLHESEGRADTAQNDLANTKHSLEDTRASLETARKDRDEALLHSMSLQDILDKANAKLASLHKAIGVEFTPFEVPKVEPPKVPEPAVPETQQAPAPASATHRVYTPDPAFDWGKPYAWDSERNQYYQEG